ncbi:MAG TPA: GerMN domain-containing protein [Kineosporiaceae bacterium]|nr:GerMN domain-containing protein [Kineosporiaceae bacterium]
MTSPAGSSAASTVVGLRLYFLRTGGTLAPAYRQVSTPSSAVAAAAMNALLSGPTAAERAAGLGTAIPAGTTLHRVTITGGTADVDLTPAYTTGGGTLSMTARVGEIVYTLTQFPSVQRVTFRIDGKPLTVLGGEGITLDRPATRAGYESLLPPVFIDSPAAGQSLTGPVRVQGLANVFEGQFEVEVRDSKGRVLAHAPAKASMGRFSPFGVTLPAPADGTGSGSVVGYDRSAKDGSVIDVFSVPVTLQPGDLADGRYPARIRSVRAGARQVGVDVVQFFTGPQAAKAAAEDHSSEVPPPNDYWLRNASTDVRQLPVTSNATITVNVLAADQSHDPTHDVAKTLQQLGAYQHLGDALFWVTVDKGRVTRIAEQYLP